ARPDLLLVSFGNLLVGLTFAGAVTTFFPLYGRAVGLSEATIGALFAARAAGLVCSAAGVIALGRAATTVRGAVEPSIGRGDTSEGG
ncbi:MAG TPA: hypothetical protein VFL91_06685, partial [Thermomicrobiales bacterium]|nr:hypothetical protein [Thermomicrobiales bacterium]